MKNSPDPKPDPASHSALRFGWAAVALFVLLGLVLESLHLVKAPLYFEVRLRRELWTLAHAHGTLLGLVNVLFATTAERCLATAAGRWRAARALQAAAILMPAGFFLGGIGNAEGDPSLAIVLVPLGGFVLLITALALAVGVHRR